MTKKDELRSEAKKLGIAVDSRWSISKLQEAITRAVALKKRQKKAAEAKRAARVVAPKAKPVVQKKAVVAPVAKRAPREVKNLVIVAARPKYRAISNVILPSRKVVDIGQTFECDEHTAKKLLALGAIEPA